MSEAHVSAEQPKAGQAARLSSSDVHPGRPRGAQGQAGQGPPAAVGLIWSIRDRSDFDRFRREGRRFRHGQLWLVWVDDPTAHPPRVAYAISRAVGSAVTRNRIRRRLRHLLGAEAAAGLPNGWYLIGATPGAGALTSLSLRESLRSMLAEVRS